MEREGKTTLQQQSDMMLADTRLQGLKQHCPFGDHWEDNTMALGCATEEPTCCLQCVQFLHTKGMKWAMGMLDVCP